MPGFPFGFHPRRRTDGQAHIKAFLHWLEEANEAMLNQRRDGIQAAIKRVSPPEGRADVRLALRLLDEEVLARLEPVRTELAPKQS